MNRSASLSACLLALLVLLVSTACSSSTFGSSGPPSTGVAPDAGAGGGGQTQCTAARKSHLVPISKVTTGVVKVLSNDGGVTRIYVDASAGGANEASRSPRVYIKLTGERVDIDDNAAFSSADWDLALKRVDLFTNGGDAGPGKGGAVLLTKDFAAVTAADADGAPISREKFFDADCNGLKDEAGFIVTTLAGWYDYAVGAGPSVKPGVSFVVLGADGTTRYKLRFVSYTARPDGSTNGQATGFFILEVAKL
jgi:hypothetical protein